MQVSKNNRSIKIEEIIGPKDDKLWPSIERQLNNSEMLLKTAGEFRNLVGVYLLGRIFLLE